MNLVDGFRNLSPITAFEMFKLPQANRTLLSKQK